MKGKKPKSIRMAQMAAWLAMSGAPDEARAWLAEAELAALDEAMTAKEAEALEDASDVAERAIRDGLGR